MPLPAIWIPTFLSLLHQEKNNLQEISAVGGESLLEKGRLDGSRVRKTMRSAFKVLSSYIQSLATGGAWFRRTLSAKLSLHLEMVLPQVVKEISSSSTGFPQLCTLHSSMACFMTGHWKVICKANCPSNYL